jgi:DNA-binding response OmpR family regulator
MTVKSGLDARILAVDDEEHILEVVKARLEQKGYNVTTASSGEAALEALKQVRPHIILLDIMMPGLSGIDFLKLAKEIQPDVGIIMVSALEDEEIAMRSFDLGAYDYVTKPISFERLEDLIAIKLVDMIG